MTTTTTGFRKKPTEWVAKQITSKGATCYLKNVRLAMVSVSKPKVFDQDSVSYGVHCLIDEKEAAAIAPKVFETIKQVIALSDLSKDQKKKAWETATNAEGAPAAFFKPGIAFRMKGEDGDKTGDVYDGYEDARVVALKSNAEMKADGTYAPKVEFKLVDHLGRPIPRDQIDDLIYSGCYADVKMYLKAYSAKGSNLPGVAKYLSAIMRLGDGERLGASSGFDYVRDDVEDEYLDGSPGPMADAGAVDF